MRLHRLRVSAFGPFAATEEIDFDALGAAGLYLIHGPTGAGKTSILDAVCFALYAAVPGPRAGSRRSLRSDHAAADAVPSVCLELTAGGRRLRVTRSPEFARPKRRGTGVTRVQAKVLLQELRGGCWFEVAQRADEAALALNDVLGMGLEQFATVVLLPQGEFATFLRATPEQRREVLERLFDTARFTDIEDWLAARRREGEAVLAAAREQLRVALLRVDDVLATVPPALLGTLTTAGPERSGAGLSGAGPVESSDDAGRSAEGPGRSAGDPAEQGWAALTDEEVSARLSALVVQLEVGAAAAMADAERAQLGRDAAASARSDAAGLESRQQLARQARLVLAALDASRRERERDGIRLQLAERAAEAHGHLAAVDAARADLGDREAELDHLRSAFVALMGVTSADPGALPHGGLVGDPDSAGDPALVGDPGSVGDAAASAPASAGTMRTLGDAQRFLDQVLAHNDRLTTLAPLAERLAHLERQRERVCREAENLRRGLSLARDKHRAWSAQQVRLSEGHRELSDIAAALATHQREVERLTNAVRLLKSQTAVAGDVVRLTADLTHARQEALVADIAAARLRLARLEGMAGELAVSLSDGSPCPVCGSCLHPRPASQAHPVTADQVTDAETVAAQARATRESVQAVLSATESRHAAQAAELHRLAPGLDEAGAARALGRARAERDRARSAAAELPVLAAELDACVAGLSAQDAVIARDERALSVAQDRAHGADQGLAEAMAVLVAGLGSHRDGCPCVPTVAHEGTDAAEAFIAASQRDPASQHDPASQPTPPTDVELPLWLSAASQRDPASLGAAVLDGVARIEAELRVVVSRHGQVVETLRAAVTAHRSVAATRSVLARDERRLRVELDRLGLDHEAAARAASLPPADRESLALRLQVARHQRLQAETLLAQPDVSAAEAQAPPDLAALTSAEASLRDVASQAQRTQGLVESAHGRTGHLRAVVHSVLSRLGPTQAEHDVVSGLADCVAGTSPDNVRRMRLSSYVLAARLEEVARLANERLGAMSEGRYALEHTDALAGRGARSGLGLRVRDAWTGASRDTSTLSGGESFMAALALALGLADAVRAEAGGLDLQTLFVDEGFGSLDEDSLEQVMTVLDGLREGGRAVGVVSHVPELRQRITAQVCVQKAADGSHISTRSEATSPAA